MTVLFSWAKIVFVLFCSAAAADQSPADLVTRGTSTRVLDDGSEEFTITIRTPNVTLVNVSNDSQVSLNRT